MLPKFWEPSQNLGTFPKFGNLPKFWEPSQILGTFPEFGNLPKFWEPSQNLGTFPNFGNLPRISEGLVTRFGMQDLEPRRFWNILRTTAIKRKSVSYIIFGMGPKTVPVVKNLPKFRKSGKLFPDFRKFRKASQNSEISIEKVGLPMYYLI